MPIQRPIPEYFNELQQLKTMMIPQWQSSYIYVSKASDWLQRVGQQYNHTHFMEYKCNQILVHSQLEIKPKQYELVLTNIEKIIKMGMKKGQYFMLLMGYQQLLDWKQLSELMGTLPIANLLTHQDCINRHYLKEAIKVLYTYVHHTLQLRAINLKASQIITKAVLDLRFMFQNSNYSNVLLNNTLSTQNLFAENINFIQQKSQSNNSQYQSNGNVASDEGQNTQVLECMNSLEWISAELRKLYLQLNFQNPRKVIKLQSLSTPFNKPVRKKSYFLSGLFLGVNMFVILTILLLLLFQLVSFDFSENRASSMLYIFPIFRGLALLVVYMWGWGWNVYGFSRCSVNYRLILEYGTHYSTYQQIIKRAGFFTFVVASLFLVYLLGQNYNINNQNQLPVAYTPFMAWLLLLGYIFFPNSEVYNPKGRKYFYRLLKDIIKTPILSNVSFLMAWATDQSVSFVIPIKDFAYTICFYTSDFSTDSIKSCNKFDSIEGITVTYVVALLPLLFRMLQCYKQGSVYGSFVSHRQFWNFWKYAFTVLSVTCIFNALCLLLGFSTYALKQKYDWGLLNTKSKNIFLRDKLFYQKQSYYLAIGFNLLFRCSWTLTLSPSVVQLIPKSTFLPFLIGIVQIFRRCMWNFFRIQKEHLLNYQRMTITKYKVKQLLKMINKNVQQNDEQNDIYYGSSNSLVQSVQQFMNKSKSQLGHIINKQIILQRIQYYEAMYQKTKSNEQAFLISSND